MAVDGNASYSGPQGFNAEQGVAKAVQGAANESGTKGGSKGVPSDIVPTSNSSYLLHCCYIEKKL